MPIPTSILFLLVFFCTVSACKKQNVKQETSPWKKIKIDFKSLDANGLAGNELSKTAVNYEFCIPAETKYWRAVKKIDKTAQKHEGRGRAGCDAAKGSWLIIGSAQQKAYKKVLYDLASLPWIVEILETNWE